MFVSKATAIRNENSHDSDIDLKSFIYDSSNPKE